MTEQPKDDRFRPLTGEALARAKQNPALLALLRESIDARLRGEPFFPATELMSKRRPIDAGD